MSKLSTPTPSWLLSHILREFFVLIFKAAFSYSYALLHLSLPRTKNHLCADVTVANEWLSCSLDSSDMASQWPPLFVYVAGCPKVTSEIATIGRDARQEGNRCKLFTEGFGHCDYQLDKQAKVSLHKYCILSFTFPLAAANCQLWPERSDVSHTSLTGYCWLL